MQSKVDAGRGWRSKVVGKSIINDVDTWLPLGLGMSLVGYGGFSLKNVWDGDSFENKFHLDRKG